MEYLMRKPLLHMGMIESIRRGTANIIDAQPDGVVIQELKSGAYMISADNFEKGKELLKHIAKCDLIVVHQKFMVNHTKDKYRLNQMLECFQSVYLKQERLPIEGNLEIKKLEISQIDRVLKSYDKLSEEEIKKIINSGSLFGGYKKGELIGFAGMHLEGSIGILEVFPQYRRCGYGRELESYMANLTLEKGWTPFAQVVEDNKSSIELQKKLGFEQSEEKLYWLF